MNIDLLFTDPEYGSFVSVYIGLAFVGKLLEPYTRSGIQRVHQKIQTVLKGNQKCAGTCGNNPSSWCKTCKDWQKHLKKYSKFQDIGWTKHESCKWSLSYEHIATIFTDSGSFNPRDLSNACSIWKRCKEFNLQPFALNNVKECRNKYFAHNHTLRVTDVGKAKVFDALKDLLSDKDVQGHINKQDCLKELEKIKNGNYLPLEIKGISEEIRMISRDEDRIIKILTKLTGTGTEDRKVLQRIQDLVYMLHDRNKCDEVEFRDHIDFVLNMLYIRRSIHINHKYLYVFICIVITIILTMLLSNLRPSTHQTASGDINNNDSTNPDNFIKEWQERYKEWATSFAKWKACAEPHLEQCGSVVQWSKKRK